MSFKELQLTSKTSSLNKYLNIYLLLHVLIYLSSCLPALVNFCEKQNENTGQNQTKCRTGTVETSPLHLSKLFHPESEHLWSKLIQRLSNLSLSNDCIMRVKFT